MNIKNIEKKIKNANKKIDTLEDKRSILKTERIKLIIKNKSYITDLSPWEGKDIEYITALDKDGKSIYIPTNQICEIRNNKLYASSNDGGIVRWKNGNYTHVYYGAEKILNIIGFIDIEVRED